MNTVKGIYVNGVIEMIEKPTFQEPVEVLIIFPKLSKTIQQIRGRFKEMVIDYDRIEEDLHELSRQSEKHILQEWGTE